MSAEAELAAIVASSFDAIISKNLDSIITSWNPAAETMFGYSAEEAVGRSVLMLIPETHHHEEAIILARIRAGERLETYETVRRRKDGSLIPISITVSPIRGADGTIVGASKIARDISAMKETDRQIHLLLREVHHRVKNNLQTVASLIQLQKMPLETKQELRGRILAMAAVHENLHRPGANGFVELSAYIRELAAGINASFGNGVMLDLDLAPFEAEAEIATSLGLIINELVTNANKYAFPVPSAGRIGISLTTDAESGAQLLVTNNGIPFDTGASSDGAGIRLIHGLASGIAPRYDFDGSQGLRFAISIPPARPAALYPVPGLIDG